MQNIIQTLKKDILLVFYTVIMLLTIFCPIIFSIGFVASTIAYLVSTIPLFAYMSIILRFFCYFIPMMGRACKKFEKKANAISASYKNN